MLTYVQYVWNRYVGEKGQGMVEYAVIVLIVVAVGVALYGASGEGSLSTAVTDLYGRITTQVDKIGKDA